MNKALILVVEDDKSVQNLIVTTLKANDYRYLTAMNGETAFLKASSHNQDIILLNLGLPDMARLRATERRLVAGQAEQASASVFINGKLKVDFSAGCAWLDEEELHLTPIEYKLLCLLSQNVGKVLTHTYLTQKIWGQSWENNVASLRVFMATLRKKIEKNTDAVQYIQTHVGVGYRMLKVEQRFTELVLAFWEKKDIM